MKVAQAKRESTQKERIKKIVEVSEMSLHSALQML